MRPTLTVVTGAAGTGKGVRLVREYLRLLGREIPPNRIAVVTPNLATASAFRRRVAAALRGGVSDWLGGQGPDHDAHLRFDDVELDGPVRATALWELDSAPIGTLGDLAHSIMAEFALGATLVAGDEALPVQVPLVRENLDALYLTAARAVVDNGRAVGGDAAELLLHINLQNLVARVATLAQRPQIPKLIRGADLAVALRRALVSAFTKLATAQHVLGRRHHEQCRPYKSAMETWLDEGMPEPVPDDVIRWIHLRATTSNSTDARALGELLANERLTVGDCSLDVSRVIRRAGGYADLANPERADGLRDSLVALAGAARLRAVALAAASGRVDDGLLVEGAIALCRSAPEGLRTRWSALIVLDAEVYNDREAVLLDALTELPGGGRHLRTVVAGHRRQRIGLASGWLDSLLRTEGHDEKTEVLERNHRSTPALIAATQALFRRPALAALAGEFEWVSAAPRLDAVGSDARNWAHNLPPAHKPMVNPVVIVVPKAPGTGWSLREASDAALGVFATRMRRVWVSEGRRRDVSVVVTPSRARARELRGRLRALLSDFHDVQLVTLDPAEAGTSRVARDVAILLRALLGLGDDQAWLGLWKLPPVGLSDRALALLREGLDVHYVGGSAWSAALQLNELDPDTHSAADVEAFRRSAPALRQLQVNLGRMPTACLIGDFASTLGWPAILAAGPEGESRVADLDRVLTWSTAIEADGIDPISLLRHLDGDVRIPPPPLPLSGPECRIEIGLLEDFAHREFDHVLIDMIGVPADCNAPVMERVVRCGAGEQFLLGVSVDPDGGVNPRPDFISGVASAVTDSVTPWWQLRRVYTALSRALRSVTFGLSPECSDGIHATLREAWLESPIDGAMVAPSEGPSSLKWPDPPSVVAQRPFEPLKAGVSVALSPVPIEARLSQQDHRVEVEELLEQANIQLGSPMPIPAGPEGADLALSTLIVRWLKRGGLTRRPNRQQAQDLVASAFGRLDDEVTSWLCDLSGHLADHQPHLFELIERPDADIAFDAPFLGLCSDGTAVVEAHVDLLVSLAGQRVWLVAILGLAAPESREALAIDGSLFGVVDTLRVQRLALTNAGHEVAAAGILFGLDATWIGWQWSDDFAAAETEEAPASPASRTELLAATHPSTTASFDRRLLLHDVLSSRERSATSFSIEEIARAVGFREAVLAQIFERFLNKHVTLAVETGKYRAEGVSELRGEDFVDLLEGGVSRRTVAGELREVLKRRSARLFELALELAANEPPGARLMSACTVLTTAVELVAIAEGHRKDSISRAAMFRDTMARLEHMRHGARLLIAEVEPSAIPAFVECVREFETVFAAGFGESPSNADAIEALEVSATDARIDFEDLEGRFGEKFVDDAMRLLLDLGMKREAPTDVSRWLEEDDPAPPHLGRTLALQPLRRGASGASGTAVPRFGVVETGDLPEDHDLDRMHPAPPAATEPKSRLLDELLNGFAAHDIDIDAPWLDVLRLVPADVERHFAAAGLMTLEDVIRGLEPERLGSVRGLDELLARRLRRDLGVIASEGLEFYLFGPEGPPRTVAELVAQWTMSLDERSRDIAKQALLEGAALEDLEEETGLPDGEVRRIIYEALIDGTRIFREVAGRLIGAVVEEMDASGGFLHREAVLAEANGARDLREVRFACQVAGHREVRIWRREFLTHLPGAHRRARLERFRRALISAGRSELDLAMVRVHAENSGIKLDGQWLVRMAELAFDMYRGERDTLVVSQAKADIVADILRSTGAAMHISDIADSYTTRPDGGARTDDLAALQKGIRAQLQHRKDVYTVDSGIYVHRSALPIAPKRLGSLARWCVQKLKRRAERVSTQDLLAELGEAGFDVSKVSDYLLMDVLSRHSELIVFRSTFAVAHTSAADDRAEDLEERVELALKAARDPLSVRNIMELLPGSTGATEADVREVLEGAAWVVPLTNKNEFLHADNTGLDQQERHELVEAVVRSLPADGAAAAALDLLESVEQGSAQALLTRAVDPAETLLGLLHRDKRVRLGSGHLVARAMDAGPKKSLLSDVVVQALAQLKVGSPGEIRAHVEAHYGYDGSNVSLSHAFLTARDKGDILRLPGFLYCARTADPAEVLEAIVAREHGLTDDVGAMRLPDLGLEELWMLVRVLATAERKTDAEAVAAELTRRAGVPSKMRKAIAKLLNPAPS